MSAHASDRKVCASLHACVRVCARCAQVVCARRGFLSHAFSLLMMIYCISDHH
jgi:hypothetical protein